MTITGRTKVYGVLANPVGHSLSPQLHASLAKEMGLNMVYVPLQTPVEQVGEAIAGAYDMNFQGMNATLPHKVALIPFLKDIDPDAAAIGAVNTLVRVEGGYKGYNTDVPGLKLALEEAGISLAGRPVIILGAGGAANAAAYLAAKEQAADIFILNRTIEKAEALAAFVKTHFPEQQVTPLALADWTKLPQRKYVVLQTTSVGMWPKTGAAPIEDDGFYELVEEAYDIIYTPEETEFLRRVRRAGGHGVSGLSMLLYQGVVAFEHWTGLTVSKEAAQATFAVLQEEAAKQEKQSIAK